MTSMSPACFIVTFLFTWREAPVTCWRAYCALYDDVGCTAVVPHSWFVCSLISDAFEAKLVCIGMRGWLAGTQA